ncbi:Uncharacterised protein [Kluyvera cryocrescens]|uniref:Uncharacterized protein n=1 Tax=Kluyvera cryocrescens TaxID=580 RepID=A0A485A701_KLUCR|nr:Uncharacterised protein [Kluyvera cryocrescens]
MTPKFCCNFAYFIGTKLMIFWRTMRKVHAYNVSAGGNHLLKVIVAVSCWA